MRAFMRRLRRWRWAALTALTAAVVLAALPASAGAAAYTYVSPLYTPKSGSNATLTHNSGDSASQVVTVKRINAIGGLMSSNNITIGAKSSLISFAGANSGAQMHLELESSSPAILTRITFTDPGDAVQTILPNEWRILGPELELPAANDTIGDNVAALQGSVGALGPKVDGAAGTFGTVKTDVAGLKADVAGLAKTVSRLRAELRATRRLLARRLPKRK